MSGSRHSSSVRLLAYMGGSVVDRIQSVIELSLGFLFSMITFTVPLASNSFFRDGSLRFQRHFVSVWPLSLASPIISTMNYVPLHTFSLSQWQTAVSHYLMLLVWWLAQGVLYRLSTASSLDRLCGFRSLGLPFSVVLLLSLWQPNSTLQLQLVFHGRISLPSPSYSRPPMLLVQELVPRTSPDAEVFFVLFWFFIPFPWPHQVYTFALVVIGFSALPPEA